MAERRRSIRHSVEGVEGRMLVASDIAVQNISLGGALIECDRRLDIGQDYSIKVSDENVEMVLRGEVVWAAIKKSKESKSGRSVPVYNAGIKFSNIISGKAMRLMNFIQDHSSEDNRVSGFRVSLKDSVKATLNYPAKFTVLKINRKGMLIESDLKLKRSGKFPMEISLQKGSFVSFVGKVAGCEKKAREEADVYHMGVEFVDIQEDSKSVLDGFIDSLEK